MAYLQLCGCKGHVSNRPFSHIIRMEDMLVQVDPDLRAWPALNHALQSLNCARIFHAIGIGANKQRQERASRLAVLLASLIDNPRGIAHLGDPGLSLREEIALARYAAADSLKPNPRSVRPNGSTDASQHHHSTDTTRTPYACSDVRTPASGSWICSSSSFHTFWAAVKASCTTMSQE